MRTVEVHWSWRKREGITGAGGSRRRIAGAGGSGRRRITGAGGLEEAGRGGSLELELEEEDHWS